MRHFLEHARSLDAQDKLREFKSEFYIKPGQIYMDGNSLGLASKRAERALQNAFNDWKEYGIDGWTNGKNPWFYMSESLGASMASLVGADHSEVLATNSTTTNIHQAVRTLYKPTENRYKILADDLNFPSDIYALQAILDDHGYSDGLKKVASQDGHTLTTDDIIAAMDDDVALILLPSVLYRSGQVLDIKTITKAAHDKNIIIGFDLCHSIGSVPHKLSEHNVDFAVWCTYKHLNGGPGSVAGIYMAQRHHHLPVSLKGWFGNNKATQFDMSHEFDQASDASQLQVGTPHVFSMAPLIGSLEIFNEAGIDNVREKSLKLTRFMSEMIEEVLADHNIEVVTPKEDDARGGHILIHHEQAAGINSALKSRNVIPDFRAPSYVRIAPVALYNSFEDVYRAVEILKEILDDKIYLDFDNTRGVIA
ncbi:MAG TPA: kynureninase [Aliicoccus persicus]|uniref:Kynureninase n=1 Tax=Aliicoccus persicus TaxID=930138 RepID=A0A921DYK1_9STAP|nr:kynureninase [Aliicoccus persicus]